MRPVLISLKECSVYCNIINNTHLVSDSFQILVNFFIIFILLTFSSSLKARTASSTLWINDIIFSLLIANRRQYHVHIANWLTFDRLFRCHLPGYAEQKLWRKFTFLSNAFLMMEFTTVYIYIYHLFQLMMWCWAIKLIRCLETQISCEFWQFFPISKCF